MERNTVDNSSNVRICFVLGPAVPLRSVPLLFMWVYGPMYLLFCPLTIVLHTSIIDE